MKHVFIPNFKKEKEESVKGEKEIKGKKGGGKRLEKEGTAT